MKFHPLADLFPLLEGADFDALVADIKAHGQREPITLYKGEILDGRNRYRACLEAGVKPFMGELDDDADLVAFVVSANLRRRHLTDDQRAMVAAKLVTCKPGDNQHSAGARTSQAEAAKLLNVSPDKVKRVAKVLKDGAPELRAAAEQGEITITAAALVAHRPLEEQGEIIAAGPKAVAKAAQKMREAPKKAATPAKPEPADPALEQDDAADPVSPAAARDAPSLFDDDPAAAARRRREVLEQIASGDDEAAIEGDLVKPPSAEPEPASAPPLDHDYADYDEPNAEGDPGAHLDWLLSTLAGVKLQIQDMPYGVACKLSLWLVEYLQEQTQAAAA